MRVLLLASTAAALALSAPAFAQNDDGVDALVAECSQSGLTPDQVGSCLSRTRSMEDNNPSPELQALEAQLQDESDQGYGGSPDDAQAPGGQSQSDDDQLQLDQMQQDDQSSSNNQSQSDDDQMQQDQMQPDDQQAPDEQAQPGQQPPDEQSDPDQPPPDQSPPPEPDSGNGPQNQGA